jgi:hypothetical protein
MATNNIFSITCPTTCPTPVPFTSAIEEVDVNCQIAPLKSEVYTLLLQDATLGAGVADWTDLADWGTAIDNADTGGTKVRQLLGVGNVAAPERTVVEMAGHRDKNVVSLYTLVFKVTSLTPQLRDFLRKFQCDTNDPKFWYATVGGIMYGKDVTGIQSSNITVDFVLESGRDAYEYANITLQWQAQTDPDFTANVLPS